jgi:hypothetical protein
VTSPLISVTPCCKRPTIPCFHSEHAAGELKIGKLVKAANDLKDAPAETDGEGDEPEDEPVERAREESAA